jgi:DNA-binding Xre family transcriptional regulator
MNDKTGHCGESSIDEVNRRYDTQNFLKSIVLKPEEIPSRFKEIRKQRGMTLRELEATSGISNPYLSQMENGKIKGISFNIVVKICSALNISIRIN